jgi:dTMP kinase
MTVKGSFITFEGIDGCGKSTQARLALEYASSLGVKTMLTREPGGTAVSEKIREILLSPESKELCDQAELLLYLASRAQHVLEKIVPEIKSGSLVICDRFQEATFAYQGFGRGLDLPLLQRINAFATNGIVPEHTFVFDIPVEIALERLAKTGKAPDRLEQNSKDFFKRVREGYLELAEKNRNRITLIDAVPPADMVFLQVKPHINTIVKGTRL